MITNEMTERVRGWFAGRLPQEWTTVAPRVGVDREEVVVVLHVDDVELADDASDAERAEAAAQAARGGFGAERYETRALQERVRDAFARLGDEMGEGERWAALDADVDADALEKEVWAWVEPLVGGTEAPLGRLWDEGEDSERNFRMYT